MGESRDDYPPWVWLAVGLLVAVWLAVGAYYWWRGI